MRVSTLATNNLEELGEIEYKNTNVVFFAIVRKDGIGSSTPYIDGASNFSQYVNVYWT